MRLIIRVSPRRLSFSTLNAASSDEPVAYRQFSMKPGVAVAANLREAVKAVDIARAQYQRTTVMVDSDILMVPADLYRPDQAEALYLHSFPRRQGQAVVASVVPELGVVALFAVERDLCLVVSDNYPGARYVPVAMPVWRYMHQRSAAGRHQKLYAYFHDGKLEMMSFQMHRFRYFNAFEATAAHDSLYFILCVWKELQMDQTFDELCLAGDLPERDWMAAELKKFIRKAYITSPTADFNRTPAAKVKDMPYDLVTLYAKGG